LRRERPFSESHLLRHAWEGIGVLNNRLLSYLILSGF
jgi:hypothetical protein